MADDKHDTDDESTNDSAGPSGRDLANPDLPDPGDERADDVDGDLDGIPDSGQVDEGFDAGEDNTALAAATAAASQRRPRASAPRKKEAATPRQSKRTAEADGRTGPVEFVRQSAAELRKVVWPTGEQVRTYFIVVVIFVVVMIGIVTGLDLGFGWLILKIFGGG